MSNQSEKKDKRILVVRFDNRQVLMETDAVVEEILKVMQGMQELRAAGAEVGVRVPGGRNEVRTAPATVTERGQVGVG